MPAALPKDKLLIGAPELSVEDPDVKPTFGIIVPVCNRGPETLRAKVQVQGEPSEVNNYVSGFTAPSGTYCFFGLGYIKKQRTKPVRVIIAWQQGAKSGRKVFTFAQKQDASDNQASAEPATG